MKRNDSSSANPRAKTPRMAKIPTIANAYAIVIAGGEGRRLWPLSSPDFPKQFVSVFGGTPLIRQTIDRLAGLIPPERILVVTAAKFIPLTRKMLPEIPAANIIGEPCRRNTAGAVAIACALVKRLGGDDALGCVLPSDNIVNPVPEFQRALKDAIAAAAGSDAIVTLGMQPERAATEYGYIECDADAGLETETPFCRVRRFVEKPDARTARRYLKTQRYLWNAGIFVWRASTLEKAFADAAPDIGAIIKPLSSSRNVPAALRRIYPDIRPVSFDYAVMEKTAQILVAKCSFDWDDAGSWRSVAKYLPSDENGNIVVGDGHAVAVAGLKDVIVVHTPEATLVMSKKSATNAGAIAEKALRQK